MATYYVKNGGNDALDGLSDANAWATISRVNSEAFAPADRVRFARGSTWSGTRLLPFTSGTGANPIYLEDYGVGAKPLIEAGGADQALYLHSVGGFDVSNIEFNGCADTASVYVLSCTDIAFDGCEFSESTLSGMIVSNSQRVYVNDSLFENNDNDGLWFYVCSNVSLSASTFSGNGGGASGDRNNLGVWNSTNVDILRNTFNPVPTRFNVDISCTIDFGTQSGINFIGNLVDNSTGVERTFLSEHVSGKIAWNVFIHNPTAAITAMFAVYQAASTCEVYNNLFVGGQYGICVFDSPAYTVEASNYRFYNNICVEQTTAFVWVKSQINAFTIFSNNAYFSTTPAVYWLVEPATVYNSATWDAAKEGGTGVYTDPAFLNLAGGNYRLSGLSPCVLAGAAPSTLTDYYSRVVPSGRYNIGPSNVSDVFVEKGAAGGGDGTEALPFNAVASATAVCYDNDRVVLAGDGLEVVAGHPLNPFRETVDLDTATRGNVTLLQWPSGETAYVSGCDDYHGSAWAGPDGNGEFTLALAADPLLVIRDGVKLTKGTPGSLAANTWGWAGGTIYAKELPTGYTRWEAPARNYCVTKTTQWTSGVNADIEVYGGKSRNYNLVGCSSGDSMIDGTSKWSGGSGLFGTVTGASASLLFVGESTLNNEHGVYGYAQSNGVFGCSGRCHLNLGRGFYSYLQSGGASKFTGESFSNVGIGVHSRDGSGGTFLCERGLIYDNGSGGYSQLVVEDATVPTLRLNIVRAAAAGALNQIEVTNCPSGEFSRNVVYGGRRSALYLDATSSAWSVKGNILALNKSAGTTTYYELAMVAGSELGAVVANNCFWAAADADRIGLVDGSAYRRDQSAAFFAALAADNPLSVGNICADPLFVNAAGGDFHLQAASSCIGTGVTIAGVTEDYDGNTIPQGAVADIGAYEYTILAPTGLTPASGRYDETHAVEIEFVTPPTWVTTFQMRLTGRDGTPVAVSTTSAVGGVLTATLPSWTIYESVTVEVSTDEVFWTAVPGGFTYLPMHPIGVIGYGLRLRG